MRQSGPQAAGALAAIMIGVPLGRFSSLGGCQQRPAAAARPPAGRLPLSGVTVPSHDPGSGSGGASLSGRQPEWLSWVY